MTNALFDWKSSGGEVVDFDDGHVPENLKLQEKDKEEEGEGKDDDASAGGQHHYYCFAGKLVQYPEYFQNRLGRVRVFDHGVDPALVQALYEATDITTVASSSTAADDNNDNNNNNNNNKTTMIQQQSPPWGTYVPMTRICDYWQQQQQQQQRQEGDFTGIHNVMENTKDKAEQLLLSTNKNRDRLALLAAQAFLRNAMMMTPPPQDDDDDDDGSNNNNDKSKEEEETAANFSSSYKQLCTPLWTLEDMERSHGVAVWALASKVGSSVPYHLDYAEQVRYETNVIVPPVLAGTLQCSPVSAMEGGTYCVHPGGLEHYQQHGYKGVKSRKDDQVGDASTIEQELLQDDTDWIRIPYRHNRMICQSGHWPHLSTRVASVTPSTVSRVIVGFNVFLHDVGPTVQRAPEHSSAFRRKVAVQRYWTQQAQQKRQFSLQVVQSNPALARLLIMAKRQKAKDEFKQAQRTLEEDMQLVLAQEGSVAVQALMDRFGRTDGKFPSPVDVQVHVEQGLQTGRYHVENDDTKIVLPSHVIHLL